MALVEVSALRRHVCWLTSTFDGCEVEFERQLKKRKAREMKYKSRITPGMGRPRSSATQKTGSPRSSATQKTRSSSWDHSGLKHFEQVDSFADDSFGEEHDTSEGSEDQRLNRPLDKVLLWLHGERVEFRRQRQVHFGPVDIEEVVSFKKVMKALNAMFCEGIRHIECSGCEERAPRRDMMNSGENTWHCKKCNVSDSGEQPPKLQAIDMQSGSCGNEITITQHDEPLDAFSREFLDWAFSPMPSRKRLRSSKSFRSLREHLAERDCDIDAEAWCLSLKVDIGKIASKGLSERSLLLKARQLVERRDYHCFPLVLSMASECASSSEANSPHDGGISSAALPTSCKGSEAARQPARQPPVSPRIVERKPLEADFFEVVDSWESLLD